MIDGTWCNEATRGKRRSCSLSRGRIDVQVLMCRESINETLFLSLLIKFIVVTQIKPLNRIRVPFQHWTFRWRIAFHKTEFEFFFYLLPRLLLSSHEIICICFAQLPFNMIMSRTTHTKKSPYVSKRGRVEGESATRARGQNNWHNTETVDGKIELWTKLNCALWRERRATRERASIWCLLMLRVEIHRRRPERVGERVVNVAWEMSCDARERPASGAENSSYQESWWLMRRRRVSLMIRSRFYNRRSDLETPQPTDSAAARNSFKFNYFHLENAF